MGFSAGVFQTLPTLKELTQETFFALLRASTRYEPRALFRTYLYAIELVWFTGLKKGPSRPRKIRPQDAAIWK